MLYGNHTRDSRLERWLSMLIQFYMGVLEVVEKQRQAWRGLLSPNTLTIPNIVHWFLDVIMTTYVIGLIGLSFFIVSLMFKLLATLPSFVLQVGQSLGRGIYRKIQRFRNT